MTDEQKRLEAILRYGTGESPDAICQDLKCSRRWLFKWLKRSKLGTDDWYRTQSRAPHTSPNQLSTSVVEAIKIVRLNLYNRGLFCGAQAIQWELKDQGVTPLPSLSTINRVLVKESLTHQRTGNYLPKGLRFPKPPHTQANQLHQTDFVGPCYLRGSFRFYTMNSVDLSTGRGAVELLESRAAQNTLDAKWNIWTRLGIPDHEQVDNEMVFFGSPAHPRGMGALIRLCLWHGVEPWFIPPREPWRNGVVEKFNHLFQIKCLRKHQFPGRVELLPGIADFEQRQNQEYRYSKLSGLTPNQALLQSGVQLRFPRGSKPIYPIKKPTEGKYHLIRLIRADRVLDVFGEKFLMPSECCYEYVQATINVGRQKLEVYLAGEQADEIDYPM